MCSFPAQPPLQHDRLCWSLRVTSSSSYAKNTSSMVRPHCHIASRLPPSPLTATSGSKQNLVDSMVNQCRNVQDHMQAHESRDAWYSEDWLARKKAFTPKSGSSFKYEYVDKEDTLPDLVGAYKRNFNLEGARSSTLSVFFGSPLCRPIRSYFGQR